MLNDKQIQAAIRNAPEGETILNDGARSKGEGSLRLRIRRGARGISSTWLAWFQADGVVRKITIGRYPEMPLALARDEFQKAIIEAKKPELANAEDRTVQKLFDGYIASLRQNGRRSADDVKSRLDKVAIEIGKDKLASEITSDDIVRLLKPIHDRGSRVMADRLRAYISAAFNWGIEAENDYRAEERQNWGIKENPAAKVKRDTEAAKPRDRNLSAKELRAVWRAVKGDGFNNGTGDAIRLAICCGQRIMETLRIDGRDVDLDAALWIMPAEKTKGRKHTHSIPLPAQAVEILRKLKDKHGDGALFPSRTGESEHQWASSLNKALRRWSRDAKIDDFQARDLRRTWKSRAHDAGIDRFTRDLIQQHAKGDMGSRHYDRAVYLPQMTEAMQKWSAWLHAEVE